jgi:magnesium transporter
LAEPKDLLNNVEIMVVDSSGNLREDVHAEELPGYLLDENALIWCNISSTEGGENSSYWQLLTSTFRFDELTVEDCFKPSLLPLVNTFANNYGSYMFMVLFSFELARAETQDQRFVCWTEVDLYLGQNYVVCVHSQPLTELDCVKKELRMGDEFVRSSAANLAYTVLDAVADAYQPAMEIFAKRVEHLKEGLLSERRPGDESIADLEDQLYVLKNNLAELRRLVGPQRDNMSVRSNPTDERLVSEGSQKYFQDLRIHLDRVMDSLDAMREHLTGISEAYTTRATRRMNQELMRLTAISTLFLPLGFITGIYGMNFVGMPEVHFRYGYFVVLAVFVIIIAFQVQYLRRRKML